MPTITNIHGETVEVAIRATKSYIPSVDSDYGPARYECLQWARNNPCEVVCFGEYGNTLWTGTRASCEAFVADRQSAESTLAAGQRLAEVA